MRRTAYDAESQLGAERLYTDNGDGTVTDDTTGLVWEKPIDDDNVHDYNNFPGSAYAWDEAAGKVSALNTPPCFAAHCDWRLPNVNELLSLPDYSHFTPVPPEFDAACIPGCSVQNCSCANHTYWSSTTYLPNPAFVWTVSGGTNPTPKAIAFYVRAVRGGL